jgi:hypothetical protein
MTGEAVLWLIAIFYFTTIALIQFCWNSNECFVGYAWRSSKTRRP